MPRELEVVVSATPCTRNFYPKGPRRMEQIKRNGDEECPFYNQCPVKKPPHHIAARTLIQYSCIMATGASVAVEAIAEGVSVARLVNESMLPALEQSNRRGVITVYAWAPNRSSKLHLLDSHHDTKKILENIRDFAVLVLEGTLRNGWAAYDVPAQAEASATEQQLIFIRSSDDETEIAFLKE